MSANTRNSAAMRLTPENERPRERLASVGAEALRDAELLAIIFRTGTSTQNAVQLAEAVLRHFNSLRRLSQATIAELQHVKGVGRVKAIEIKAALELGKRMVSHKRAILSRINNSADAAELLMPEVRLYESEVFLCLHLSTKNDLLRIEHLSKGGMDWVNLQPRDVFRQALREGSHGIILAHNHPSGDPEPSSVDIAITRSLASAASLLGIRLLDHIILGDGNFVSLKERGMF